MNNNNYIEIYIYLSYNNQINNDFISIIVKNYKCNKCKYIGKLIYKKLIN